MSITELREMIVGLKRDIKILNSQLHNLLGRIESLEKTQKKGRANKKAPTATPSENQLRLPTTERV